MYFGGSFDFFDSVSSGEDEGSPGSSSSAGMFQMRDMSAFQESGLLEEDPYSESDMESDSSNDTLNGPTYVDPIECYVERACTGGAPDETAFVPAPRLSPSYDPPTASKTLRSFRQFSRYNSLSSSPPPEPSKSDVVSNYSFPDTGVLCFELFPNGIFDRKPDLVNHKISVDVSVLFVFPGLSVPGFVVDSTIFVNFSYFNCDGSGFNDWVLSIIEFSESELNCQNLIVSIPKSDRKQLAELSRAFMYAGFEIISPRSFDFNNNQFLLGYDLA
ncbi:hypothetical protein AYI68_g1058 [Smittium mucronatum]|uniref:Uncharacterized protein n=1 Tax=Smittium mucronatum TaxID=133383 RepID=A0A1R0H6N0_9FUNG|nr:hypothetical protein AYI68_g1058 [Smittium mucronatum]